MLNHVISGEVTSEDLTGLGSGYTRTLATGAGEQNVSLFFDTSDGVTFNGVSSVITPDVKALNGIVHVVDAVIDIPNIVDHAVANPGLSSLVAALTDGGNTTFTDLLSNEEELFTVFAPGNDAFSAFTNPNSNDQPDVIKPCLPFYRMYPHFCKCSAEFVNMFTDVATFSRHVSIFRENLSLLKYTQILE